jgi:hypothetical protein
MGVLAYVGPLGAPVLLCILANGAAARRPIRAAICCSPGGLGTGAVIWSSATFRKSGPSRSRK